MSRLHTLLAATVLPALLSARSIAAQQPTTLTLSGAIRFALTHHPTLAASRATVQSAQADVDQLLAARLPSLDAQLQLNRATGNAVAGAFFTMSGVPGIGGPPGNQSPAAGAWGSTAALVSALPLTGLLRTHRQLVAQTARVRATEARLDELRLQVAVHAAGAYLEVSAGHAQRRIAVAARRRALTIDSLTRALALQGLRPGADSVRTSAEVASAEIDIARADARIGVANARLAEAIGSQTGVTADTTDWAITNAPSPPATPMGHPMRREADALMRVADAERVVASAAWFPRVDLFGAALVRGSGEPVPSNPSLTPMRGLTPNVGNWAVGVVASWPLLGAPGILAQQRRASAEATAARARAEAVSNRLAAETAEAQAAYAGARAVAERTRVLIVASAEALTQVTARYRAGLTTLADVADAQRQLTRAEGDAATARIEEVSARILVASATGDIEAVLALLLPESAR